MPANLVVCIIAEYPKLRESHLLPTTRYANGHGQAESVGQLAINQPSLFMSIPISLILHL